MSDIWKKFIYPTKFILSQKWPLSAFCWQSFIFVNFRLLLLRTDKNIGKWHAGFQLSAKWEFGWGELFAGTEKWRFHCDNSFFVFLVDTYVLNYSLKKPIESFSSTTVFCLVSRLLFIKERSQLGHSFHYELIIKVLRSPALSVTKGSPAWNIFNLVSPVLGIESVLLWHWIDHLVNNGYVYARLWCLTAVEAWSEVLDSNWRKLELNSFYRLLFC